MQEYNPSSVTNIVILRVTQYGQYLWVSDYENEQAAMRRFEGQNWGEKCRLISPSLLSLNLANSSLLCSTLLLSERTPMSFYRFTLSWSCVALPPCWQSGIKNNLFLTVTGWSTTPLGRCFKQYLRKGEMCCQVCLGHTLESTGA